MGLITNGALVVCKIAGRRDNANHILPLYDTKCIGFVEKVSQTHVRVKLIHPYTMKGELIEVIASAIAPVSQPDIISSLLREISRLQLENAQLRNLNNGVDAVAI